MTKVIINEGLDYHDLEGIVVPVVSVDEYSAKMGRDSEIITLAFTVKNKKAGEDLSDWFERGYDFVLDAQVSDGELTTGTYLVFVEMNRRTSVPERIVTLLDDLETLTDIPLKDWTVVVDDEEYSDLLYPECVSHDSIIINFSTYCSPSTMRNNSKSSSL